MNPKKSGPRHIMIKLLKTKNKEKNPKISRKKKHISYNTIQVTVKFLSEMIGVRGSNKIYSAAERKNYKLRILYPPKIYFKNKGEIKRRKSKRNCYQQT